MGITVKTPTDEQIHQLRDLFNAKYEQTPPIVPFDNADIKRINGQNVWCRKFLEMYDLDVKMALEKLWSTCIWRQEQQVNQLNEHNVRQDYLNDGVIFPRNQDVDGKPLLILKTKYHVKGAKDLDEVIRILIYWVERIHRSTDMEQITLFFDMDGTGLGNLDLEFIKRIIETFKLYYPNALNYILVYEMAWVLNAAFSIVKSILPEKAIEILKIISKKNIRKYVNEENCLIDWGGTDDYKFTFVSELNSFDKAQSTTENNECQNFSQNANIEVNSISNSKPKPKPKPMSYSNTNGLIATNNDTYQNYTTERKVHFAANTINLPDKKSKEAVVSSQPNSSSEEMLRITPFEYLKFSRNEQSKAVITLANVADEPITFKIQTTSPEKFRVRPRSGILKAGESINLNIILKSEHTLTDDAKDKFLIMSQPAGDMELSEVAQFWKEHNSNSPNLQQQRLCCVYDDFILPETGKPTATAATTKLTDDDINQQNIIRNNTKALEKQLRFTQILQVITLIFLLMLSGAVIYLLMLQVCGAAGCFNRDGISDGDLKDM